MIISEVDASIEISENSLSRKYSIRGSSDEYQVVYAVIAYAPLVQVGLIRKFPSVRSVGQDLWEATVTWEPGPSEDEPEFEGFDFEITGESIHRTQSLATVASYAAPVAFGMSSIPGVSPDYKGAIGVTEDGIEGVDVESGVLSWSEPHKIPRARITRSYIDLLEQMAFTFNDATWRGYPKGEIEFRGVRGKIQGDAPELMYSFRRSRNRTGIVIGEITGIAKRGAEYLWVKYDRLEDSSVTPARITQKPANVFVEQVVEYTTFSALGIG